MARLTPSMLPGATPPFFPGGTPPISPPVATQPPVQQPGFLQRLHGRFGRFMGGLAGPVNPLLSQSEQDIARQRQQMAMAAALLQASRPVPKGTSSPLGALGSAMQAGQTAGDQFSADVLRARLAQSQLKQGTTSQRNVQSTVILDNGNIGIVRRDGTVEDTGTKARGFAQRPIDTAQGIEAFDPTSGTTTGVISGAEAERDAAAQMEAATTEAGAQATRDVETRATVPREIQAIDDSLQEAEQILKDFEDGKIQTGMIQGRIAPQLLGPEDERFQRYIGKQVIAAISSATFGQLSEGERKFLETTTVSRAATEEANMDAIKETIRILRKARAIEEGRLTEAGGTPPQAPQNVAPEGTVITNPQGQRLIKRNGQWVQL